MAGDEFVGMLQYVLPCHVYEFRVRHGCGLFPEGRIQFVVIRATHLHVVQVAGITLYEQVIPIVGKECELGIVGV